MKIRRFLFHLSVSLVILAGGLLLIEVLQTGRIDGLKLLGLAAGLLLMGVLVILRSLDQTRSATGQDEPGPVKDTSARGGSASRRQPAKSRRNNGRRKRR